jgi:Domain of unknown function (DUF222)
MTEAPAALGDLLADVGALAATWAGALTLESSSEASKDVLSMSDHGLVAVTEALAAVSKRVDALTARCAAGLAQRSPSEAGNQGLARRFGHSTPAGLIASVKGSRHTDAAKLVSLGEATEPRSTFTGERLAPKRPRVAEGLAAGELSVEAASVITAFLDRVEVRASVSDREWAEELLAARAPIVGVDGLHRLVKQLEARLDPDGVKPREDELRGERTLRIWEDAAGMINLRGRFDPATGAPIKVAIESLVGAELYKARDAHAGFGESCAASGTGADAAGRGDAAGLTDSAGRAELEPCEEFATTSDPALVERRTIAQMNADALADIARLAISTDDDALPALRHAAVVARIDLADLEANRGHATIDGIAQPVSAATARQLAASAGVIPVVCGGKGEVLDLGRDKRLFTKAQRLALAERDGGCAHPDCNRPIAFTQAHHIRWWTRHTGPTDLDNGVLLCSYHHHLLHDDGWGIFIRDNRAWFVPPPHIDPEQRPRPGNRSPHLELPRSFGLSRDEAGVVELAA